MTDSNGEGTCPFCGYTDDDTYILMLHVETLHSEGESPFVVREHDEPNPTVNGALGATGGLRSQSGVDDIPRSSYGTSSRTMEPAIDPHPGKLNGMAAMGSTDEDQGNGDDYVICPEADCGEAILLTELDEHIEMHAAEKITGDEPLERERSKHGRRRSRDKEPSISGSNASLQRSSRNRPHSAKSSHSLQATTRTSPSSNNGRGWWSSLVGGTSTREPSRASPRGYSGQARRLGVRGPLQLYDAVPIR